MAQSASAGHYQAPFSHRLPDVLALLLKMEEAAPALFDGRDKFCLDGEGLIPMERSENGADGTIYHTERYSFHSSDLQTG